MNPSSSNIGLQLLLGRRSIRVYRPGDVNDATIRTLLEAAMAAPSAVAKDPWRFVVVRSRATLTAMTHILPNGQMLGTAPVGIVVCGDQEAAHSRQLSYLLQDCAACIENLLLAAHALGLGACWLGIHPRQPRVERIASLLRIPPPLIPVSAIAIGWPGETKEPRTRFNPAYVCHEQWTSPPGESPSLRGHDPHL